VSILVTGLHLYQCGVYSSQGWSRDGTPVPGETEALKSSTCGTQCSYTLSHYRIMTTKTGALLKKLLRPHSPYFSVF